MPTLPDRDHWLLSDDELHPAGPRWTVATVTELYEMDVSLADRGHLAMVLADGLSWWICTLSDAEGGKWRRIDAPAGDGSEPAPIRRVEYDQPIPSLEWDVVHGLDGYPPVVVMDDAGELCAARVRYVDRSRVVAIFASPRTGRLSIGW